MKTDKEKIIEILKQLWIMSNNGDCSESDLETFADEIIKSLTSEPTTEEEIEYVEAEELPSFTDMLDKHRNRNKPTTKVQNETPPKLGMSSEYTFDVSKFINENEPYKEQFSTLTNYQRGVNVGFIKGARSVYNEYASQGGQVGSQVGGQGDYRKVLIEFCEYLEKNGGNKFINASEIVETYLKEEQK